MKESYIKLLQAIFGKEAKDREGSKESELEIDIEKALDTLSAREAQVLTLYFGLGGLYFSFGGQKPFPQERIEAQLLGPTKEQMMHINEKVLKQEPLTLEEIGMIFNLTRERIRQIKTKAIRRLQYTSRSKALRTYLN